MRDIRQWIRTTTVDIGKLPRDSKGRPTSTTIRGISIKDLRIKYTVEKTLRGPPNTANILIYNLNSAHVGQLKDEFDDVRITSGFKANPAIIFHGNVRYSFHYRDGVDWISEIQAADGDKDYHAITQTTLAAGASASDVVAKILEAMPNTAAGTIQLEPTRYLRGKLIAGPVTRVLDQLAREHGASWSIQDGFLHIIAADQVLASEAVVVNENTGMIGAPEISGKGIRARMLLNPQVKINGLIILDNNNIKIQALQQYTNGPKTRDKKLARLDPDGRYKVYKLKHECDTRGEAVTEVECIAYGTTPPKSGSGK